VKGNEYSSLLRWVQRVVASPQGVAISFNDYTYEIATSLCSSRWLTGAPLYFIPFALCFNPLTPYGFIAGIRYRV